MKRRDHIETIVTLKITHQHLNRTFRVHFSNRGSATPTLSFQRQGQKQHHGDKVTQGSVPSVLPFPRADECIGQLKSTTIFGERLETGKYFKLFHKIWEFDFTFRFPRAGERFRTMNKKGDGGPPVSLRL